MKPLFQDRQQFETAISDGRFHTVRMSFSDRLGAWRGKRVPARHFLDSPVASIGSGLIVSDVLCDQTDNTPYTNMSTGYPDMHLTATVADLAPVGWANGELYCFATPCEDDGTEIEIAPPNVLDRVEARLREDGCSPLVELGVTCRLMTDPQTVVSLASRETTSWVAQVCQGLSASGISVASVEHRAADAAVTFWLTASAPTVAAVSAVVTKGALRELALRRGLTATFMTRIPGAAAPIGLGVRLANVPVGTDEKRVAVRLVEARPFLQPSITAFKAGAPGAYWRGEQLIVAGVSTEADPFTSVAIALAAVATSSGGPHDAEAAQPPRAPGTAENGRGGEDLAAASARVNSGALWLREWLGGAFVDNSVPLLAREAELFASAVTDWEIHRYWGVA